MKEREAALAAVAGALGGSRRVWITTHIKGDGDGIGSELALCRALKALGKEARIINDTVVPHSLKFLMEDCGEILVFDPPRDQPFISSADTVVVLDVGLSYRLGRLESPFMGSGAVKICVDHHLDADAVFTHALVDEKATSTGELLHPLLKRLGARFTPAVAIPLYASISVDSGNFSYERCTPETFRIAAELVEAGANPYQVHLSLNWHRRLQEVKLDGEVIQRLRLEPCGEIAHSEVTADMLAQYAIDPMEMPTVINIPLSLGGIEIALLFVELGPCHIKVSARSKGKVRVSDLARLFGGGGHPLASGFSLHTGLDKARVKVLAAARALLGRAEAPCAEKGAEGR